MQSILQSTGRKDVGARNMISRSGRSDIDVLFHYFGEA
jgi:hypothetical protein